jgi:hypothetical protein
MSSEPVGAEAFEIFELRELQFSVSSHTRWCQRHDEARMGMDKALSMPSRWIRSAPPDNAQAFFSSDAILPRGWPLAAWWLPGAIRCTSLSSGDAISLRQWLFWLKPALPRKLCRRHKLGGQIRLCAALPCGAASKRASKRGETDESSGSMFFRSFCPNPLFIAISRNGQS